MFINNSITVTNIENEGIEFVLLLIFFTWIVHKIRPMEISENQFQSNIYFISKYD